MKQKVGLIVTLVSLFLVPTVSQAAAGQSWSSPKVVEQLSYVDTATLTTTGDVVYYRYTITDATPLAVQITVSRNAAKTFAPQLVIFSPSEVTAHPVLLIDQPPQTIATAYAQTPPETVFDVRTQTLTTLVLEQTTTLVQPGTYYLAVYNAGTTGGEYRLSLTRGVVQTASWTDAWLLPVEWWRDQSFAGFGWLTLITPAVILLFGYLVYLRLDHHQLHPHKIYAATSKAKPLTRKRS